ncbi:replication initiation protein [Salisaeta longa]|uniref:replication initiation protein n=1 Tax=Salisaeta longa TaxID=503170 RepID=UPI0003B69FAF|nr:replication initiation protein [Salisaeta longa]
MSTQKEIQFASQDELVVKSNRFVTAKYDWTPTEHRIIAMMIAQLKKDDESFDVQTIHIRDIREMTETRSKDLYSRGEEICQKLLAQKIEIRTTDTEGLREYEGYNLLSTCRYSEGSGAIQAKFNEDMRPFLLELRRRFTIYQLQYVMRLRSQYSIRIYEMLKMREGLGFYRVTVERLRELLMITHKYTGSFSQVKAKVLEPAREEIKEKCDILFTYHVEREGRTPVAINFMIHSNRDVEPAVSQDEIKRLKARRVPDDDAAGNGARASEAANGNEGDDAPLKLDGYQMFLTERTQEELEAMGDKELQELREAAEKRVSDQHPEVGSSYRASEVYRVMKRLWADRQ